MRRQARTQTEESPSSPELDQAKSAEPGGSTKKRPSRAGTRSVSTLSAVQLERKRANDREAQRAIRQRTRDHIESLERRIRELTEASDSSERMTTLLNRNQELEKENSFLRLRLQEAGLSPGMLSNDLGSPEQSHVQSMHAPQSFITPRRDMSHSAQHGYQASPPWATEQAYLTGSNQTAKKEQHHVSPPVDGIRSSSGVSHWAMNPSSLGSPSHETGSAAVPAAMSYPPMLSASSRTSSTPEMGHLTTQFDPPYRHRFSQPMPPYQMHMQQATHYPQHGAHPPMMLTQPQQQGSVAHAMHGTEPDATQPMYGHYQHQE